MLPALAEEILDFWFGIDLDDEAAVSARFPIWFGKSDEFDRAIRARFGELPERARRGEYESWRSEPRSTLTLILCLDQFPRNLYRGWPESLAFDEAALEIARDSVAGGVDRKLHPIEAVFLYLPFEHAEDLALQQDCVALFSALGARAPATLHPVLAGALDYAQRHLAIIERFGRFPHRNAILGRSASEEEEAYLVGGGDAF